MDDRVPRNNGNAVIHFLEGNLGVNIAQALTSRTLMGVVEYLAE